ncbi:YccV-like-domain-containing protein [Leucogyrophana mollusca]|uniref:YccV-like-domain-containing protein n=1 Tax=Leucogyrophana mollusca TaxID=85980 RepID=A0ACB8BQ48_9AGAM|nr:YccV-like-domain-containing protein [Leucogyrophana mollusca]
MPLASLPFDIYVHILEHLPSASSLFDATVKTLSACLRANTVLRDAASLPGLWEPHYKTRYTVCDLASEASREEAFGGNWKLMYMRRRSLDQKALEILNQIVQNRVGRHERAQELTNTLSYDVWNVLEEEAQRALPLGVFLETENRTPTSDALPRRYWANVMLGAIARSVAIKTWGKLLSPREKPSLEVTFASLSAFFGVLPMEISAQLDILGTQCRSYLVEKQHPLDRDVFNSNSEILKGICAAICDFMRSKGFQPTDNQHFYSLHNRFPHRFLTTHKETIPISLVFIFVCIARRLGIDASPVDFPARVLAHVSSPDPKVSDVYIDVFGSSTQAILSPRDDIPRLLMQAGVTPISMTRYVKPAGPDFVLIRASRNILASSLLPPPGVIIPEDDVHIANYIGLAVGLLFMNDRNYLAGIQSHLVQFPLDLCAVLIDSLASLLQPSLKEELIASCVVVAEEENAASETIYRRSTLPAPTKIKHFVGQVFQHKMYGYIGFIYGWEPTCMATERWIAQMDVDSLSRGRHQPFYHVIAQSGSQHYVAEENINPTFISPLSARDIFKDAPLAARYFTGMNSCPRGSRLRLSPELQLSYPEDEQVAEKWMQTPK